MSPVPSVSCAAAILFCCVRPLFLSDKASTHNVVQRPPTLSFGHLCLCAVPASHACIRPGAGACSCRPAVQPLNLKQLNKAAWPGPAWPRHACTIYATTGVRSRVVWCARGIHIRTCSTRRTCMDEAVAAHGAQTAGSKGRLYWYLLVHLDTSWS